MNIRNHLIEIQCNHRDINDVAQALIHSIIFFRTHGKFNYKHEGSYSIGTLGYERAFCDQFDLSYIRCSSLSLVTRINNKIQEFVDRITEFTHSGLLTLEFYTKKPSRWPFNDSKFVWEMWNIKITLIQPQASGLSPTQGASNPQQPLAINNQYNNPDGPYHSNHHHQYSHRNSESAIKLEDLISQKLLDIVRIANSEKCILPQMPTQPNLDTVFDTSFSDLQPYLYNISYRISETAPGSHSVIGGMSTKYGGDGGTVADTAQSSLKKFLLGTLEL
ncbi:autophagy-related 101 [Olea europaea subsp. europaea]|uniref:Autophagy-related protein 101 n=1 Tax=Olea europaea subsp. europaea TaxID=158383 RepID=A0A8S0TRF3_OLEEU|nr:autophagy-related 101 [Olea europaea subsp. europaea]